MKFAVFFRNLNLGRANCPDRTQFEAAFMAAGAVSASSFLTNGTLVFEAGSVSRADKILGAVCKTLQAECGLKEPAFLRELDYLAGLPALDAFAGIDRDSVYEFCISFLSPAPAALPPAPLSSARGNVKILRFTEAEAFSLSFKPGKSPGSPNAFLEKQLGRPATTRSWNTVLRLLQKFG